MAETYIRGKPAGAQTAGDSEYVLSLNRDGSVPVTLNTAGVGVTYAAASQVTVTGSIGDLLAAGSYEVVIFRALSTNTQSIWWGPAGTTVTTGMELKPGESIEFDSTSVPVNLIRALSTSGSQTVIVITAA